MLSTIKDKSNPTVLNVFDNCIVVLVILINVSNNSSPACAYSLINGITLAITVLPILENQAAIASLCSCTDLSCKLILSAAISTVPIPENNFSKLTLTALPNTPKILPIVYSVLSKA